MLFFKKKYFCGKNTRSTFCLWENMRCFSKMAHLLVRFCNYSSVDKNLSLIGRFLPVQIYPRYWVCAAI